MYISKVDGKLNYDMIVQRDTIINANTLLHLGKFKSSNDNLSKIEEIKRRQKEYWLMENAIWMIIMKL